MPSSESDRPTDPAERMAEIHARRDEIRAGIDLQGAIVEIPAGPALPVGGVSDMLAETEPAIESPLPTGSEARKGVPLVTGLLDYFPAALAAVAALSKAGNDKHNPGEPLHHARSKSADHADSLVRHLVDRGLIDRDTGHRHSTEVAWRALALLQEELEEAGEAPLPRGARS